MMTTGDLLAASALLAILLGILLAMPAYGILIYWRAVRRRARHQRANGGQP